MSMSVLCPTCDIEISPGGRFCPRCGCAFTPAAEPTSGTPQPYSTVLPQSVNPNAHIEGLSVWLIWIGLGLVIAPLKIILSIFRVNLPFLFKASYQAYFASHHVVAMLLASQVIMNLIFVMSLLFLNYLFFAKKRGFPPL